MNRFGVGGGAAFIDEGTVCGVFWGGGVCR